MTAQSSTTGGGTSYYDFDNLVKAVQELGDEPFAVFMRSKGCPPDAWDMVLPSAWATALSRETAGQANLPSYVKFSPLVTAVFFLKRSMLWASDT